MLRNGKRAFESTLHAVFVSCEGKCYQCNGYHFRSRIVVYIANSTAVIFQTVGNKQISEMKSVNAQMTLLKSKVIFEKLRLAKESGS